MQYHSKEASASEASPASDHDSTTPSKVFKKDPNRESGCVYPPHISTPVPSPTFSPTNQFTPLHSPRAILALAGASFALFCTVGFLNAFGVFQEYYLHHQLASSSPFAISWLGSFTTFVLFVFAIPSGILVDRYGPTFPLLGGSIAILLGVFMTSLCGAYWEFFLAQAALLGVGFSFVLTPAVAVVPRYFKKNRALGMGLTVAGSSMGGIVWPIMLNNLLNSTSIGFGWTLRIVGCTMLPLLVLVCLAIRLPLAPIATEDAEAAGNVAGIPQEDKEKKEDPKLPMLKNPSFVLLCVGLAVVYLGFFGPFFYVSSYSVSLGQSSSFSFYLLSILNGASLVGRILPGIIADKYGAWNLLIISALSSAVVGFCWTAATSVAGVVVWSMAYGFVSGVSIAPRVANSLLGFQV